MRLDEGLVAYLTGNAGVSALVSDRVGPAPLPQDSEQPAVTYQIISRTAQYTHRGPAGLTRPRIQVDCWSTTYSESQQLAEQVRLALSGFRGQMGDVSVSGLFQEGAIDLHEPEANLFRVSMDFLGWVAEAIP